MPDTWIARASAPRLLEVLDRSWDVGQLTLELPDGSVHAFGPAEAASKVRVTVKKDAFFRRLLLGGDLGVGESYMDGEWEADDLALFLKLAATVADRLPLESRLIGALNLGNDVLHWLRWNTRRGTRRNIARHYDLSNDFFRLFLDETMTYSSAVFDSEDQPLAEAQRNKYRLLAEKAQLSAGDHVLEIGCGWGGFALYAARSHGCRVTAITVSQQQYLLAKERVAASGMADRIDVRFQDYRDVEGPFDKIVSIEMFEALGQAQWPVFFAKLDELLAPHGLVALQTISIADYRFEAYARHCDWIQKHIFPGSLLASLHHVTGAMIRASRLGVYRLDDIGAHYALTLERWRKAFLSNLGRVRALGFDERFTRMWDYYLAACQALFATRQLGDLQLVLTRPGNPNLAGVPRRRSQVA